MNINFYFQMLFSMLFITACSESSPIDTSHDQVETSLDTNKDTTQQNDEQISESTETENLENLVLMNGDTNAYQALYTQYVDKEQGEFLSFALIMANKYNYTQAYFDCYFSLFEVNCMECTNDELNKWSLENLDAVTRTMALDYLKKAADLGHDQALDILKIYKDENKYL
ncbi:MAG: hypothetical protein HYZ14_06310 [Bacteroidetes bacterium]|nr:hypothetical protein [Bacteroidota bacterium]